MWGENVLPLFNGEIDNPEARAEVEAIFTRAAPLDLLLCGDSSGEYAENAARVMADRALRDAVGAAGRTFCRQFLNDTKRSADIYAQHILDIVASTATSREAR